ncbi:hypothetical protein TrCOL_g1411 [Triparma columacea]|uniref:Uncharacterized protein n=1 Tax=Triparma columacea TaxID=722753 RepID=A0A9W7LC37_9STRA|nr:hypothetical protein TrCOL_g1411 [Triparma columacea]
MWNPSNVRVKEGRVGVGGCNVMAVFTGVGKGQEAAEVRAVLKGLGGGEGGGGESFVKVMEDTGGREEEEEEIGALLATAWINTYGRTLLRTV